MKQRIIPEIDRNGTQQTGLMLSTAFDKAQTVALRSADSTHVFIIFPLESGIHSHETFFDGK